MSDELRPAIREALGLDPLVSFDDYEFVDRARFLRAEVERLRMQLAACGVAAMGNTPETAAQRITRDNPYWSASYGDVCAAVDREMLLRGKLVEAREALGRIASMGLDCPAGMDEGYFNKLSAQGAVGVAARCLAARAALGEGEKAEKCDYRQHDWQRNNGPEGGIQCRRCGEKFTREDAHHAETGE